MLISLKTHEEHNYLIGTDRRCITLLVIALSLRVDSWAASSLYKTYTFCSIKMINYSQNHATRDTATQLSFLSQVTRLIKFVRLIPATNAISEQSASAMCRIKTYAQPWLNYGWTILWYCIFTSMSMTALMLLQYWINLCQLMRTDIRILGIFTESGFLTSLLSYL